jgi:hypothetical protein
MTYEEFEWHILRLVYEEGVDRLQPTYLAYTLGVSHEMAKRYLGEAVEAGVLELDFTEDGAVEYFIPGVDRDQAMPRPIWKAPDPEPAPQLTVIQGGQEGAPAEDGSIVQSAPTRRPPAGHGRRQDLPPTLAAYIKDRYGDTDGSVVGGGPLAVIAQEATVDEGPSHGGALVPFDPKNQGQILRVETSDDAFCDPSQTIFMRQIRVHGVQSEAMLRDQIQRLFESFGYKALNVGAERLRFERGSVTFILTLVPLFVLILPLFVYLFLYCMGRSTIHQEPLELDVHIRKQPVQGSYDIDLTFIGLHGVVLGAADQRVLNQEIDTLRDELRWALAAS